MKKPLDKRRRDVTMNELDRAARRFVADVDARSDDIAQPMIAALALIMLGRHMDHHAVARVLGAGCQSSGIAPAQVMR
jgi:hypothetical protein